LRVSLNVILDQIATQLQVDAVRILLLDPRTQVVEQVASRGFWQPRSDCKLRLGESWAGYVALTREPRYVQDLQSSPISWPDRGEFAMENFQAYFAAPLIAKGQVKGVLEIFHRSVMRPEADWYEYLEILTGQTAIALDNAALFSDLQSTNAKLAFSYDATLEGWVRALDLRDKETEGHSQRVTELTVRLAQAMGFEDEQLVQVRRGALLHDIGKLGIPDSILLKPGPLTEEEWGMMRRHPVYAYEWLSPIPYLRTALEIPYCHHERCNGSGYPRGLRGEHIPLAARIFMVVDVWDALCSDRSYRPGWPRIKILDHLRSNAGVQFDAEVVNAFLRLEAASNQHSGLAA